MVPVAQRPDGYSPLGVKNLDPGVDQAAGPFGPRLYDAILAPRCGRAWAPR